MITYSYECPHCGHKTECEVQGNYVDVPDVCEKPDGCGWRFSEQEKLACYADALLADAEAVQEMLEARREDR